MDAPMPVLNLPGKGKLRERQQAENTAWQGLGQSSGQDKKTSQGCKGISPYEEWENLHQTAAGEFLARILARNVGTKLGKGFTFHGGLW